MNDEPDRRDGFLGRWSKRKNEARERHANEAVEPAESQVDHAPAAEQGSDEPFDLSTLPGVDEITPETSLADFMRKEVPAALRNAALRRAWALDPAIRDYVNPAREYAYDWNTPGGVPGNGPIDAAFDAIKQVAEALKPAKPDHTLGLGEAAAEPIAEDPPPSAVRKPDLSLSQQHLAQTRQSDEPAATEQERAQEGGAAPADLPSPRRRHGGAAPV